MDNRKSDNRFYCTYSMNLSIIIIIQCVVCKIVFTEENVNLYNLYVLFTIVIFIELTMYLLLTVFFVIKLIKLLFF